jgi:hypothetical protein
MKGYHDLVNVNKSVAAHYQKRLQKRLKEVRRGVVSGDFPQNWKNIISPKYERMIHKKGFEVLNWINAEIRAPMSLDMRGDEKQEHFTKGVMDEYSLSPMFSSSLLSWLKIFRVDLEQLWDHFKDSGDREKATQLIRNISLCYEECSPFVADNQGRIKKEDLEDFDVIQVPEAYEKHYGKIDLLDDPSFLFFDFCNIRDFFGKQNEPRLLHSTMQAGMTEAFSVNSILGTDANEKENQGIMWNETMIIRALNYFYDQEESERVVIYPESADLLWDIVDSEYHLDGLDISQCLNNFVLMMPTNYESYEHLGFKGSYYVSVTTEMEMDARSYESCSKFFKKQGLPGTSWAWEQKAMQTRRHWHEGNPPKFSSDMSWDEVNDLVKFYGNPHYQYVGESIFITGGLTWSMPIVMAQALLMAYNGHGCEKAKYFVSQLTDGDPEGAVAVIKLVFSLMIYINALGDEVLHKGVPNKKENKNRLIEKASSTEKSSPQRFTLKGPKGYTGRKQGAHYRRWHFRTLKHERYYQSGEWAGKPIGSRVVFVRDSFVNKDVSPHVLTDGTNVEEKVISPERVGETV